MNDKDKEAFENWFVSNRDSTFAVFVRENYPDVGIKWNREPARSSWQAACEYKQKEIDELSIKVFKLSLENSRYFHLLVDATLKIEKLQAENAKLRECVEFYANRMNWSFDKIREEDIFSSHAGKRARQCLKELDNAK